MLNLVEHQKQLSSFQRPVFQQIQDLVETDKFEEHLYKQILQHKKNISYESNISSSVHKSLNEESKINTLNFDKDWLNSYSNLQLDSKKDSITQEIYNINLPKKPVFNRKNKYRVNLFKKDYKLNSKLPKTPDKELKKHLGKELKKIKQE